MTLQESQIEMNKIYDIEVENNKKLKAQIKLQKTQQDKKGVDVKNSIDQLKQQHEQKMKESLKQIDLLKQSLIELNLKNTTNCDTIKNH